MCMSVFMCMRLTFVTCRQERLCVCMGGSLNSPHGITHGNRAMKRSSVKSCLITIKIMSNLIIMKHLVYASNTLII